jgi:hypothetical protein
LPGYRATGSLNETWPTAGTESRIHSAAMTRWYEALIIATSSSVSLPLLFQQIDIALKNQWFRQNRNFLSVSLTY